MTKPTKYYTKTKAGFTLVELLVVISVLAVLSGITLGILNASGIRAKSRDAQRIADLKRIQAALELYFADYRHYPQAHATDWTSISGTDNLSMILKGNNTNNQNPNLGVYLQQVPVDPTRTARAACSAEDTTYMYKTDTNSGKYIIIAKVEVPTSRNPSPCENLTNWSSMGCSSASANCYGVQNPL